MSNNATSKEISPGVFLHTKQNQTANGLGTFLFEAEVTKPNILEFTCDFSGSQNIAIEGKSGLTTTTVIDPFQRKVVAKVNLKKNWSLKTKFGFVMKPPGKEYTARMIIQEHQKIKADFESAKEIFNRFPIPILPVGSVLQILSQNGLRFHDIDFEPSDATIYGTIVDPNEVKDPAHWRRTEHFMTVDPRQGLKEPAVFYDMIEPGDIMQGSLGNCWFMCAIACLAERPALIERLFITKEINPEGLYRVKLCKNGEWQIVTVDDYFPCWPASGPMFSRAHGNELWVLILEKAYAKLHGNYYLLRGGFANEALMDLTGCPSQSFHFDDEEVQVMIRMGVLWKFLKMADDLGYMICASTPGEDRFSEDVRPVEGMGGLVSGHAYSVIQVKEYKGHKLLNLRNPWGNFEWTGDWGDNSPLWTKEMKDALKPTLGVDDGTFWMSWKDALEGFKSINVCKVRPWHEVRIKGIFVRGQDPEEATTECVLSKWYYKFDIQQKTKVIFGLHQEDVRIAGVAARRPFIDMGFVLFKKTGEGSDGLVYHQSKGMSTDRQVELEMDLDAGTYVLLPQTTGCLLRRPPEAQSENITLMDENEKLHELVESTINDIFRKFDVLMNRELSYPEFKGFFECLGKSLTEKEFKTQILDKYASTQDGITLRGFQNFFKDAIRASGEKIVWGWFKRFGYDKDLYSIRSRCFVLTLHSDSEIKVSVRDAISTDMDNRANIQTLQKLGSLLEVAKGIRAFSVFHKEAHAYTYGVINDQKMPIECMLDFSDSTNMLYSTKTPCVRKRIEPGQMEFMLHSAANPTAGEFMRSVRSQWTPLKD